MTASSTMRAALFALTLWPALALSPVDAHAREPRLIAFELCAGMDGRAGVDCGDTFDAGGEAVYAVLKVRSQPGAIELIWRHAGEVVQRQRLQIKALRASGYRTWARQRLGRDRRGAWSLEVTTADGQRIAERRFTVGAAGSATGSGPAGSAAAGADDASADEPGAAGQPAADDTTDDDATDDDDSAADETADTVEARTGVAVEQDDEGDEGDEGDAATARDALVDAGATPDAMDGTDAIAADAMDGVDAMGGADAIAADATGGADAIAADTAVPAVGGADAAAPDATTATAVPAPATETNARRGTPDGRASRAPSDDDAGPTERRRLGAVWLFMGGVLLLAAGVLIMRRRAARRAVVVAPPVAADPTDPAADALTALATAVTALWTAWWTAADGDPQGCLNRAFRAVPDGTRLALDHIAACNGLEDAASQYAIAPDGTAADVLRARLYAQTPALLSVVCALPVELDRLALRGSALPEALATWGGDAGAAARLFAVIDRAADVLGVERLALVPYDVKATTAKTELGAELKPFILPEPLVEQLAAGSHVVRVDTPPFSPGPTPVVRGFVGHG